MAFSDLQATAAFCDDHWLIRLKCEGITLDSLRLDIDAATIELEDLHLILPDRDYADLVGDLSAPRRLYKRLSVCGNLMHLGPQLSDQGWVFGPSCELAFHGMGNLCFAAGDFHRWSLTFEIRRGELSKAGLAQGVVATVAPAEHPLDGE
jgi:hypothetical protein